MATIKCFLLTHTGRAQRVLRRYSQRDQTQPCSSGWGYHNATVVMDVVPFNPKEPSGDRWDHQDPRWPKTCRCGYVFQDRDEWQLTFQPLFTRSDGGPETSIQDAPVGAMWWAPWMAGHFAGRIHREQRGNGPHLIVKTPGGDWDIDAPASNGDDGWSREGEPPHITARPSIGIPTLKGGGYGYHGFLTNGELVEC